MFQLTPGLKSWLIENDHAVDGYDDEFYRKTVAKMLATGQLTPGQLSELISDDATPLGYETYTDTSDMTTSPSPSKVFQRFEPVDAGHRYSEKRYVQTNKHGQTVVNPFYGHELETLSDGAAARHGVLLKHLAMKAGLNLHLSDHERALFGEVVDKAAWSGKVNGEWVEGVRGVKSLIDDNSSGGLEIVPIEFDSDVITFPLLSGELFPHVDIRPIPRGRRVEGASIGTPTMQWGGFDDSAIDLFDTSSLVAPIDTTIFTIDGAIEVGRDFLSDSPVNVGSVLTGLIGQRLQEELDKVIAIGNGTTQPQGIFTGSGLSVVNTDNGGSGPPTLNDYLTLLFSLPKQYRTASMKPMFISNDTSYQRSRSIRIDPSTPTTDQRPVLTDGSTMSFQSYMSCGLPHKIQNDIGNSSAAIVAMSRYRMYRRAGLEIRWESGGRSLATRNMMLLVFRARYGGRLMDTNAAAKWSDGQS